VLHVCVEVPCVCSTDGGPDAGPVGTPVSDDGCSAAGGAGAFGLPLLALLLLRRRRLRAR